MSKMAPVPERSMSWWSEGLGAAGHSSRTNELRLGDAARFIGSRLRFLFRILLRSHLLLASPWTVFDRGCVGDALNRGNQLINATNLLTVNHLQGKTDFVMSKDWIASGGYYG